MGEEGLRTVVRAERSGRNIASYTLSTGEVLSVDELKDLLLAGEEVGNVRLQRTGGKVWVRLRATVPVTVSTLVATARNRAVRRRELMHEQMQRGFEEELSELQNA